MSGAYVRVDCGPISGIGLLPFLRTLVGSGDAGVGFSAVRRMRTQKAAAMINTGMINVRFVATAMEHPSAAFHRRRRSWASSILGSAPFERSGNQASPTHTT